ncbi:hypothetical protein [Morganella morganii]|uniref:hypothetical protein n=1 Tax=Morganella morganii TaxID=582 RepID=UPI0006656933|nr:hypothetical protein [Morganella morganii]
MDNKNLEQQLDAQHILLKAIFNVLTSEQREEVKHQISHLSQAARYPHLLTSFQSETAIEDAEKAALDLLHLM